MLPLTYLKIEPENFAIGEEVVAIGHMLGLTMVSYTRHDSITLETTW